MQTRLEGEEAGGDQVHDVEVAVADAEDGELDLEAPEREVQEEKKNSGMMSTPTMLAISW